MRYDGPSRNTFKVGTYSRRRKDDLHGEHRSGNSSFFWIITRNSKRFPTMKILESSLKCVVLGLICFLSAAKAWLPNESKIRGVNLGGLFIIEPWMMGDEWNRMGCGSYNDEFSCVKGLGQTAADAAFQKHWGSWITQVDITQMKNAGLNTVRIPLGFWMNESLVQPDEFFPRGGFTFLDKVCDMASAAGLYIILDLHGAPGGQSPNAAFTGNMVNSVGFFTSANYERAYTWLEWITIICHTHITFRNVGAIEIVNEPVPNGEDEAQSLFNEFYPTAWKRMRAMEDKLNVASNNRLHIQMMDARWSGRDPTLGLGGIDLSLALYDGHYYRAFDCAADSNNCNVPPNRRDYLYHSCYENVSGHSPLIVGEWSLQTSHPDGTEFDISRTDAVSFYRSWFGAQLHSYENERGWIFWSWKVNWIGEQNDWRWGYQQAIQAGVIPSSDPTQANNPDVCANLH